MAEIIYLLISDTAEGSTLWPGEEMAGTQGNGDTYVNLGLMPKGEIFA